MYPPPCFSYLQLMVNFVSSISPIKLKKITCIRLFLLQLFQYDSLKNRTLIKTPHTLSNLEKNIIKYAVNIEISCCYTNLFLQLLNIAGKYLKNLLKCQLQGYFFLFLTSVGLSLTLQNFFNSPLTSYCIAQSS